MTELERRAWAEEGARLRARADGLTALAKQGHSEAVRLQERRPEEAKLCRESAEWQEACAKVAAAFAEQCRQKAETP